MQKKPCQIKLHPKTHERLTKFARDEGILNHNNEPIISHVILKMIRWYLDTHDNEELEKIKKLRGGNTFGLVDSAMTEFLKKYNKNY